MSKKYHKIKSIQTEINIETERLNSPTYGKVSIPEMLRLIKDYYNKTLDKGTKFSIIVGTDSQTFSTYSKFVPVITCTREGSGGIYFYRLDYVNKVEDVRKKLNYETQLSLLFADTILSILESEEEFEELYLNSNFSIHVDAGDSEKGKTRDLIQGIVGWIKGTIPDIEVYTKPESFASSCVADRLSK